MRGERDLRVCFLPGALNTGGVARNTARLASEFVRNGYRVDYFLTYKSGQLIETIPESCRVFSGNTSAKMSLFAMIRYLKTAKPDAVISARDYLNILAFVAILLTRADTIHIATLRTASFARGRAKASLYQRAVSRIATVVYGRTDHVVAVSKAVAYHETLERRLPEGLIKVIYNPVAESGLIARERSRPNPSREVANVCAVGRLVEQKDFETFLKVVCELSKRRPVRARIVGDGPLKDELVATAERLGISSCVVFTGALDSAIPEIANADVLIQTSLWEGLPTVLIEALAVGTNVVATNAPGGAAEILENGKYGWLVPCKAVDSIAEAVTDALENSLEPNFLKARASVFSPEAAFEQYAHLINARNVRTQSG